MSIAPGSAARRETTPIDEASLTRIEKLVEKQRNFTAIAQKTMDSGLKVVTKQNMNDPDIVKLLPPK